MSRDLLSVLIDERNHKINTGIYNKLQVDFAYNSNHIEGSRLTHDQTRYIFETRALVIEPADKVIRVDDIIETDNHFKCFSHILDTIEQPLSANYIKDLHRRLKTGTASAESMEAVVGDYKKYANYAGETKTSPPQKVDSDMNGLLSAYNALPVCSLYNIADFHARFEKIHPFYDGNGRVGRLLMFKECVKNGIVPFIITDEYKIFYGRNLKQWQDGKGKEALIDTFLLMQDNMKALLDYFEIDYDHQETTAREVLKQAISEGKKSGQPFGENR